MRPLAVPTPPESFLQLAQWQKARGSKSSGTRSGPLRRDSFLQGHGGEPTSTRHGPERQTSVSPRRIDGRTGRAARPYGRRRKRTPRGRVKIRAAVLERFGEPLEVQELELAEPRAGEVLVRLVACGVCHTDLFTASGADPSGYAPTVLGHEGAGVVERVGDGRDLGRAGRPRRHALLAAVPRVRALPRPAHESLPRDPGAAGPGLPARRDDAALARRRAGAALHGHLDVRGVHGDAGDRAGQGRLRRRRSTGPACSPAGSRPGSARR